MYVAVMLTAYDEILQIVDDPEWISAFKYDIVDHMPYLCEVTDLKYYESFYRYTRELIAGLKSDYCSEIASILERAPSYPPEPPRPTTP